MLSLGKALMAEVTLPYSQDPGFLETTRVPEGTGGEQLDATEDELTVAEMVAVVFEVVVTLTDTLAEITELVKMLEEAAEAVDIVDEASEDTDGAAKIDAELESLMEETTFWSSQARDELPYGEKALPYTLSIVNCDT